MRRSWLLTAAFLVAAPMALLVAGCAAQPDTPDVDVSFWKDLILEAKADKARLAALVSLLQAGAIEGMSITDLDPWALANGGIRITPLDATCAGEAREVHVEVDHPGNSGGTTHYLVGRWRGQGLEVLHTCWTVYYLSDVTYGPGRITYRDGVVTPFQIAVQSWTFEHLLTFELEEAGFALKAETVSGVPRLDFDRDDASRFRKAQAAFERGECAWRGDPVAVARRFAAKQSGEADGAATYEIGFRSDAVVLIYRQVPGDSEPRPRSRYEMGFPMPAGLWSNAAGVSDSRDRMFVYRPLFGEVGARSIWAANFEMFGKHFLGPE